LLSGYKEKEQLFVYYPLWFDNVKGDDVIVGCSYGQNSFFKSGYWCNSTRAGGKPIMLRKKDETERKYILMAFDPCFRNYTENTYRILANTLIFSE